MAAAIFGELVRDHPRLRHIEVRSAGTMAREGGRVSFAAVQALKEMGLDISDHRAMPLSPGNIGEGDLMLTMTADLAEAVKRRVGHRTPVYSLPEYVGAAEELPDLFVESVAVCRGMAGCLRDLLSRALVRLEEEAK